MVPKESLHVTTANRSYPIHIGRNLAPDLASELAKRKERGARLAVITDERVREALPGYFRDCLASLPTLALPPGETSKSLASFGRAIDFLADSGLDRSSVVLAFGGGVVGDLAGFAAAAYLRGIDFIQVPTTLLAMVDSSVGGKTGVNIAAGKNLVGAFHQPVAVYADLDTLSTLPRREFTAGMAEVIKYGLIADLAFFEMLEAQPALSASDERLPRMVKRNCQTKADIVQADEKEQAASGGRALLNLGHTFAHAIENVAGYGEYLHGEAVGIGLVAATRLSHLSGRVGESECERVASVVASHGLPVALKKPIPLDRLEQAMMRDKKARAGSINFILLNRIGEAITSRKVNWDWVKQAWTSVGAVIA